MMPNESSVSASREERETAGLCRLGEPLSFRGFRDGSRPMEPGTARLTAEGDVLVARGEMTDRCIFNRMRRDNDRSWLLGDTFELLFQIRGCEDYYEFHSTPEGYRLQLHLQDHRTIRTVPFEEKLFDAGLVVQNRIDRAKDLWECELRIPFAGIGLTQEKLAGSRFVIVRQNYSDPSSAPEITVTRVFPQTVHEPARWHTISLRENKGEE